MIVSVCGSVLFTWTYRHRLLLAFTPWVVNVACVALTLSGIIRDAQVRFNFDRHLAAREHLVRMVEAGELQPGPGRDGFPQQYGFTAGLKIDLPPGFEANSDPDWGLRVWERDGALHALFVVQRGMFAGFDGFVFRSDDQPPLVAPKAVHGDRFNRVKAVAPHWWWVMYGEYD
ncbi:MAG: hypothetical protein AB7K36_26035 [Chloroflexota bacterium]